MVVMARIKLLCAMAAVIAVALSSCRMGGNDYSEYHTVDPHGWAYGDTLSYAFIPADTVVRGNLSLSVSHTNDYYYSNLYLEVTVSDSLTACCDTVALPLADDFGRWNGRGIGTDFQYTRILGKDITLRRPVSIAVRHIMRDDCLSGIEQVGISFEASK